MNTVVMHRAQTDPVRQNMSKFGKCLPSENVMGVQNAATISIRHLTGGVAPDVDGYAPSGITGGELLSTRTDTAQPTGPFHWRVALHCPPESGVDSSGLFS